MTTTLEEIKNSKEIQFESFTKLINNKFSEFHIKYGYAFESTIDCYKYFLAKQIDKVCFAEENKLFIYNTVLRNKELFGDN